MKLSNLDHYFSYYYYRHYFYMRTVHDVNWIEARGEERVN